MSRFDYENQISLRQTSDWFEGVGSLYDYNQKRFVADTSKFATPCKKLEGTYLQSAITLVEAIATIEGVKIGRIRLMRLMPKTCLTFHQDPEEFRYHIPLETNPKCFFVVKDKACWMPDVGALYRFKTRDWHTAINASLEVRTHIVFDTYTD